MVENFHNRSFLPILANSEATRFGDTIREHLQAVYIHKDGALKTTTVSLTFMTIQTDSLTLYCKASLSVPPIESVLNAGPDIIIID